MSTVAVARVCDCNPSKTYATVATFKNHLRSDRHQLWQLRADLRDAHTRLAQQDVELRQLRRLVAEGGGGGWGRKRRVSEAAKKQVAAKQQWLCGLCNTMLPGCFEVDHIVPLYQGGNNAPINLMALCRNCHGTKTQLDMID